MNHPRPCGCKGKRTCVLCEAEYNIKPSVFISTEEKLNSGFVYCPLCNKAWSGWNWDVVSEHPNHSGRSVFYPGVYIALDFITTEEETELIRGIKTLEWSNSQSGRRKQNFGPKCNFKKKKIQLGSFSGFPRFTQFVQDRFNSVEDLKDYHTVEQCALEYDPNRGASIDPHIDDCWVWGERIVTLSLLADTFLTMTKYTGGLDKYNLQELGDSSVSKSLDANMTDENCIIRIPMPRRSLLVLSGPARYMWEHCILREDVTDYRICLTYREFTSPYLNEDDSNNTGKQVLEAAKSFW